VSSVLTWTSAPRGGLTLRASRLRDLQRSHHAMWNYVTYRDAIGIVGLDPDELYPGGATRLPDDWADLGWLTCFSGPPDSAVEAMRAAVTREALNQYTPDLIEPLRDEAARLLGRPRDDEFEVIGTEGAQAGIALSLLAVVDPGDEVIVPDPGYFHIPSAVIAAGARPVTVRADASAGFTIDPEAVADAITPRTRAICVVDPANPYGTVLSHDRLAALADLAERNGVLLVHDVTHGALAVDPESTWTPLPGTGLTDRAVATFSVSHCWGMAGARLGFLAGPRALMRGCLQLKAAVTRLNTNLISQHGALAALRDREYLAHAEQAVRANLDHLRQTLATSDGVRLAVEPQRGLACAVEIDPALTSAQELMVALFARRIAVYPGDGLGSTIAADTIRLNLSHPDRDAFDRLRGELPDALVEAASGRWREPVAELMESKGTPRALKVATVVRGRP
jgi:aspartate/methionine/tyrosine aminotransferase